MRAIVRRTAALRSPSSSLGQQQSATFMMTTRLNILGREMFSKMSPAFSARGFSGQVAALTTTPEEMGKVAKYSTRAPVMTVIRGEYRWQQTKYINKWLRMHGRLPAHVYSPDIASDGKRSVNISISLDDADITRLLQEQKNWFLNTVFNLKIGASGGQPALDLLVLPKQLFMHPARRGHALNINFIVYTPGGSYDLVMPVRFEGVEDCKGCREGGSFLFGQEEIDVRWRGSDHHIPRDLIVDLRHVERGASVHLKDLGELPHGLSLRGSLSMSNPVLCHVAKTGGEASRNTRPWMEVEDDRKLSKRAVEAQAAAAAAAEAEAAAQSAAKEKQAADRASKTAEPKKDGDAAAKPEASKKK